MGRSPIIDPIYILELNIEFNIDYRFILNRVRVDRIGIIPLRKSSVNLTRPQEPTTPSHPRDLSARQHPQIVSLRVKLLVGFSLVFSLVFAGAFYWFYTFTTDKAISRLRADLRSTLTGAAAGLDVDELMALYETGEPNVAGFSSDPRYLNQMAWFQTVQTIEPRAWLYSYIVDDPANNRRVGEPAVLPGKKETIYLVDLWAVHNPAKAVGFLESDQTSSRSRQVLAEGRLVEETRIYEDEWGSWISAFAPLRNEQGEIVAILGLDIEADYVFQLQKTIRQRVLFSFIMTYSILFSLIYVLSGVLTRHLAELTRSAEQIAAGNYTPNLSLTHSNLETHSPSQSRLKRAWESITSFITGSPDEMNTLAQVFDGMVESIRTREQMIRESKEIEDEIRQALQVERELNELKSRFVSMVSHEFRTPLTVLRTSVELLENYGHLASEEKRCEYFKRMRGAIANMTQLLEDVLVVGKAEAGKLEFKPNLLDLETFCQTIIEEIKLSLDTERAIALTTVGDYSEVYADQHLLRPVLTNLLSNAVKYSAIEQPIDVHLICQSDTVLIKVQDWGIGIPKEDQMKLFELFHRAKNAEGIRGTGLGLAIVKQCIAQHHGKVSFESQLGVGTTFTVQLPRYPRITD
jgi:signal transduction histidine kinase